MSRNVLYTMLLLLLYDSLICCRSVFMSVISVLRLVFVVVVFVDVLCCVLSGSLVCLLSSSVVMCGLFMSVSSSVF